MKCPHCNEQIAESLIAGHLGSKGGLSKSKAKIEAAKINGRLGGKPKKYCKGCGSSNLKLIKKMPRFWYYECPDCNYQYSTRKF
jgi:transposase-like protein|tara:strand:+ start:119 stop:370 length:252 start_codon:yes stop_codon:yes gene_type:complete